LIISFYCRIRHLSTFIFDKKSVESLLLLVLDRCKDQLDLTQIGHSIPEDERIVILQIQLNAGAQRGALSEENQMLELEKSLHNLIRIRILVHLDRVVIFTDDRFLLSKITHTLKD
jgi:hypothetical protein